MPRVLTYTPPVDNVVAIVKRIVLVKLKILAYATSFAVITVQESNNKDVPIYPNGCCYSTTRHENCKYLTDKGCSVRNVACKLFICGYIKKTRKVKFSLNKIYLSKYTLNFIQKVYLSSTFFTTKDVLLKGLLKRRNLYGF